MVVKQNVKFVSILNLSLCIVARVPNCNQYSCKNQLKMNMSMSTNCSTDIPNFLTYILDNLFSFCHKDESDVSGETSET